MRAVSSSYQSVDRCAPQNVEKTLLRFLTCGSVDDGKSTLIGRLLYDSESIPDDQLASLERDSLKYGTNGDNVDFALLLDGLEAEREQGITIDVAYRFFATNKRRFIVADAPGHEEYTCNMATGASNADLTIVLIDARRGILPQTRRHLLIAHMLGVRHLVLAVNKIDLIDYNEEIFNQLVSEFSQLSASFDFSTVVYLPLSARLGDNVIYRSTNMPWYKGPTLLEHLETIDIEQDYVSKPFRFPVQYTSRPHPNFRGFSGQVASGKIAIGDPILIAKSGRTTRVKDIVTMDGQLSEAREGQAVTIVLEDDVDVSRGNFLISPTNLPEFTDQLQAHVIWFDSNPLMPGRSYILRTECDSVTASISSLKYSIDVHTFAHVAAKSLGRNEFGVCNLSLQTPIVFDSYKDNRATGNFILIDRATNVTAGAGMIDFALRRAHNIKWQSLEVSKNARANLMNQQPVVLWFTGLSGSGKSTIANSLEKVLHSRGRHTILLDGDNVRHGLNRDLGFTDADRVENIRRVAEVAKLMTDAGLMVIVSFISPFNSERQLARELMGEVKFIEVFVDTPIKECMRRDPKGLYKRALSGEIKNFTGLDSPYERPEKPEISLSTEKSDPETLALEIMSFLGFGDDVQI